MRSKATRVGLIYRTETTSKNCKTEKLKSKSRYVRSNSKSLGHHVVRPEEEKERLQWEGFAEKGFTCGMKENSIELSGPPYHQWGPPSLDTAATRSSRHCLVICHRVDLRVAATIRSACVRCRSWWREFQKVFLCFLG